MEGQEGGLERVGTLGNDCGIGLNGGKAELYGVLIPFVYIFFFCWCRIPVCVVFL